MRMMVFWIATAMAAGGCALLVILLARRGAGGVGGENPALIAHRRQLSEIDELAERGLLNPEDKAAARAEAARRLLSVADAASILEQSGGRGSRLFVAGAAVSASVAALALYLIFGGHGLPDQPYSARLAAWRRTDPGSLNVQQLAAVLRQISADRPNDPKALGYLGRAELAAGDPYAAAKALKRAAALSPRQADVQLMLAEALLDQSDGRPTAEALDALRRTMVLDPDNLPARYSLGRQEIAEGDLAGGIALWRGVLDRLAPHDPRRAAFAAEIQSVAAGGSLETPQSAGPGQTAPPADLTPFIRGMVASLAARLSAHPDDADGWKRLVRSYGVLHDKAGQMRALSEARRHFTGRADVLKALADEAEAHPA